MLCLRPLRLLKENPGVVVRQLIVTAHVHVRFELLLQLDMACVQIHQAVQRLVQDAIIHALTTSLGCRIRTCVARIVAALGVQVRLLVGKQPLDEHCHSVVAEEVF